MLLKTYRKQNLTKRAGTSFLSESVNSHKGQSVIFAGLISMRFVCTPMINLLFNLNSESSDNQHYIIFCGGKTISLKRNILRTKERIGICNFYRKNNLE